MLSLAGAALLGIAFGIVLQRGSFCGASLLSTVVLHRDRAGLFGIGAAVCVSMVGFAVLAQLGWIIPNPQPMRLLSAMVGGLVFGVGMVLAGGCVTGTLYKAGEGRLTSMLALFSIGVGAAVVDGGIGAPAKKALVTATRQVRLAPGLDELAGASYPLMAAILGGAGVAIGIAVIVARQRGREQPSSGKRSSWQTARWSPATAGVAIGVLSWIAYLLSSAAGRNYALGGLGGVRGAFSWLVAGEIPGSVWMVALVAGIVAGSALSAHVAGAWKLRSADAATLLVALLGGLLVGAGASIGRGCFIGNTITGLALLSLHSMVFSICAVAGNLVTTVLYLRGLR